MTATGARVSGARVPGARVRGACVRATYRRIAPFYDLLDAPFERGRYAALRGVLFAGLEGRLLDAGIGTGRNIPFYPPGVQAVGIDLSRPMLARARKRRTALGRNVPLAVMDVVRTGFPDASFDAVVASFVFCVLDESLQRPALAELARILKPGGTLRLLDYSLSARPWRRFAMALWAPWVRWAYGASFARTPRRHLEPAGFEIEEDRFLTADILRYLSARRLAP